MGYLSCNAAESIATCGSYEILPKRSRKKLAAGKRPGEIIQFDVADLRDATGGFSSRNLLGKGSYGSVYKARFTGINLTAAVKNTKESLAADNEAEILSGIYHPRLVNLVGFGVEPGRGKVIVVEYMPNGSLYDLLHGSGKPAPGWVTRARFAVQIAWGVNYLHSSEPPVIHRDIKSSNVLIDGGFNCRVGDFGLAVRGEGRSTPPAGTMGYLDPGYLAPGDLSVKSDVFSFGILLLEMISGRNAIDVGHSPPSVVDWAVPVINSGDVSGIWDPRIGAPEEEEGVREMAVLAARCVESAAERRPEMAEALEGLKGVYKRMKRRSQACVGFRRRAAEAGPEKVEVVRNGSRKNGRVSSAAGAGETGDVIGDRVRRSKSMGSTAEIKFPAEDLICDQINMRRVGLNTRTTTVRLRKSKSTRVLPRKGMVNTKVVAGSATWTGELKESKLLADLSIKEKD